MFAAFRENDLENIQRLKTFLEIEGISLDVMEKMINEGFKYRDIQNLLTIRVFLNSKNENFEDLNELIEKDRIEEKAKREKERERVDFKDIGRPCPTEGCNGKLMPFAGNEEGGEVIWACRNCRYSEYDGRTMAEVIKESKNGGTQL